ncbi:MAG: tyrosine-type recombinase/integrase, partial [Leadbetterella sp.]
RDLKNIQKTVVIVSKFLDGIEQDEQVDYKVMMNYISQLRKQNTQPKQINTILRALRHFFDYLNQIQDYSIHTIPDYNPAAGLQVKDIHHRIRHDYLSQEALENLVENYMGNKKVLLGLLVYQGLRIGEIERLEKQHFDLRKGTVYITKNHTNQGRTLKLEANQIYDLALHIGELQGEKLYQKNVQGKAQTLCQELRELKPSVHNSHHLRGSRISHWLRHHDIREVQYLGGFKTIAGVEKYKSVNLEDLAEKLKKYHPH